MEMIDVLNRLKEIQESRPGVVDDAVANLENLNPKQPVPEDIDDHGMIVLQKAGFDPAKVKAYMAVFNDHGDTSDIDQMNIEKVGLADAMSMVLASHDVENESVSEAPQTTGAEDYSKMTDEKLIQTYNAVMANAYPGDADAIEDEMKKRNLEESKKTLVKEEDAYDNERFMIKDGKATKDNSDTADKKDHVYAPDAKTALQLHKQGKKVYKEESDDVKAKDLNKFHKKLDNLVHKSLGKSSDEKKEDITGDKQNQKQRAVGGEKKTFKEVYKKTKKEAMNTTGDATVDNANQNLEPTEKPENDPDVKVAKKKTDVGSKTTGVDTSPEIAYKN